LSKRKDKANESILKSRFQDIVKRLVQHHSGYNQSTKAYLPWILLFSEEYGSRELAREGEKKLKTSSGRRFIRKNYLPIR
jgi:putative endonuclease